MRLVQIFFQDFIRCLVGNLWNAPLTVHEGAPVHDDECQFGAPEFRLAKEVTARTLHLVHE